MRFSLIIIYYYNWYYIIDIIYDNGYYNFNNFCLKLHVTFYNYYDKLLIKSKELIM